MTNGDRVITTSEQIHEELVDLWSKQGSEPHNTFYNKFKNKKWVEVDSTTKNVINEVDKK